MPYRKSVFANNQYYHIINRGVANAPIFTVPSDYKRFLRLLDYYRFFRKRLSFSHFNRLASEDKSRCENSSDKLIEIHAYCLMPNHFHLLLCQLQENGISRSLSLLQNSYAKYFNLKHKRIGALFQSMFKAVRIENDYQLLHVSRYIHLNPSTGYLIKSENLTAYPWSSFADYLSKNSVSSVNTENILDLAGGRNAYKKFVLDQAEYQKKLNNIKHLLLENP